MSFRVALTSRVPDGGVVRLVLVVEDSRAGQVETLVLRIGVRNGRTG